MENVIHAPRKKIKRSIVFRWIVFAILLLFAIVMMYPLVWMLSTSVKANRHVYGTGLIPPEWHFENFINVWSEVELLRGFANSTIITVPIVVCSVFFSGLAAYAFAKLNFPGKSAAFFVMLGSSMVPFAVVMLPQFILFHEMGMLHGAIAYVVPRLTGGIFTIFFLRQFLYGIPDSVIEAAKLDGASQPIIFIRVVLPLLMPALVAQLILGFINIWNDYLGPLVFIRDKEWRTLPLIISAFNSGTTGANNETPMLMAASILSMVPVLAIFAVFQKKIINNVMLSGVK